ncbi:hypothetical protein [Microbispora bryophytorum]|uniref:hypothetical protein n=1 Tax=Microbispora bryophytorum TaxID=1460882 RepID=UPI00371824BF
MTSAAVQAGTAADAPPPAGAGEAAAGADDAAAGASLTLGATSVGADVTGGVSDVELAVVGVAGDEGPQAETPARVITPGTASSRTALAGLTVQRFVRRRDTIFFPDSD